MGKALKNFEVTGRLILLVSVPIKAENIEDAVAQSKELIEHDFVKIKGSYLDGSVKVTGVNKSNSWDTEQDD